MGTIIKRGKKYQVQISAYKNGQQNRITKTFNSKAAAKRWEMEMEILKGNQIQLVEWSTTFSQFYSDFVYFVKKREVRVSTFLNYERSIKIIQNLFGTIQLKNLNDLVIQHKIDEYAKGRSKRTVQDLLTKIKTALKYAYAKRYIPNDFTYLLKSSGSQTTIKRNKALSFTEHKILKDYLEKNLDVEVNIFIYTVLETGLRKSECLGLRPENIFKNYITVKEAISPNSTDTKLKSRHAYRDVPISKRLYELLISLPVTNEGYIFNKYFKQSHDLQKILHELQLTKTTIHGLRSTYASIAYAATKDDMYIAKLLGHSNSNITKEYYIEILDESISRKNTKIVDYLNSL